MFIPQPLKFTKAHGVAFDEEDYQGNIADYVHINNLQSKSEIDYVNLLRIVRNSTIDENGRSIRSALIIGRLKETHQSIQKGLFENTITKVQTGLGHRVLELLDIPEKHELWAMVAQKEIEHNAKSTVKKATIEVEKTAAPDLKHVNWQETVGMFFNRQLDKLDDEQKKRTIKVITTAIGMHLPIFDCFLASRNNVPPIKANNINLVAKQLKVSELSREEKIEFAAKALFYKGNNPNQAKSFELHRKNTIGHMVKLKLIEKSDVIHALGVINEPEHKDKFINKFKSRYCESGAQSIFVI